MNRVKEKCFKAGTRSRFLLLLIIFHLPLIASLYGAAAKNDIAVGVNYPGFGVRYFLKDKIAPEFKLQFESGVSVLGLRGYYYLSKTAKYLLFSGLEFDIISFKGGDSKGSGFAGEIFIGGEYFFAKNFSFQLDLGPAIISLKDKDTSESVNGAEYVANLGVNYYFGKGGSSK